MTVEQLKARTMALRNAEHEVRLCEEVLAIKKAKVHKLNRELLATSMKYAIEVVCVLISCHDSFIYFLKQSPPYFGNQLGDPYFPLNELATSFQSESEDKVEDI